MLLQSWYKYSVFFKSLKSSRILHIYSILTINVTFNISLYLNFITINYKSGSPYKSDSYLETRIAWQQFVHSQYLASVERKNNSAICRARSRTVGRYRQVSGIGIAWTSEIGWASGAARHVTRSINWVNEATEKPAEFWDQVTRSLKKVV